MNTRKDHLEHIAMLHEALAAEYRALARPEEPLNVDCGNPECAADLAFVATHSVLEARQYMRTRGGLYALLDFHGVPHQRPRLWRKGPSRSAKRMRDRIRKHRLLRHPHANPANDERRYAAAAAVHLVH